MCSLTELQDHLSKIKLKLTFSLGHQFLTPSLEPEAADGLDLLVEQILLV